MKRLANKIRAFIRSKVYRIWWLIRMLELKNELLRN